MAPKKQKKTVTFSEEIEHIKKEEKTDENININEEPLNNSNVGMEEQDDLSCQLRHVIVQLPISADHAIKILSQDEMCNPLEYNPNISEPTAYIPVNFFSSKNVEVSTNEKIKDEKKSCHNSICHNTSKQTNESDGSIKNAICFWCCHSVEHNQFGMPIRYDSFHKNFTFFGTFCSLECVSAYNFSIHMGSIRAWDVQSWIQIMARNYGIMEPIRPAPSRYSLQMFDGTLTIEEFRNVHKTFVKSIIANIPPLVSMKPQIESLNTSFFSIETAKDIGADGSKKILKRKTPLNELKKTLESKLNLSYTSLTEIIEAK